MALATFIHEGRSIDYTPAPGSDIAAGSVVVQDELVGITKADIKGGTLGALAVEGVFDVVKAVGPGTGIGAGAIVHWDATNSVATTADGGGANKRMGKAVAGAATTDAKVRVRLSQ